MKIRVMPTVIIAIVSASLLVGGWFIYQNVATVHPLERIVAQVPGVLEAKPVVSNDAVTVDLTLRKDANLRVVYDTIATQSQSIIGTRELKLAINQDSGTKQKELNEVWSSNLFDVAQAMEHRNYSEIPTAMKHIEQNYSGVQATSEMDETNVYITLKNGDSAKYIILPRTPDQMGAWPNA
ncbi:hypothetical protein Back11_22930 [Paenibacillus baekrokdamisoli]|uniref:Uncharacterized protein n=1 Tax=Paenibacillus baekrokdamisoli TaxID=1712516 RepID=A0A3G9JAS9_9BACL|nr:hypothetical protein [Paenibacillus baekrokdamisoli]MBB3069698.1 hypothetical protein [Paenibacillus baekrokdamisoli]BBH20948.1 hypothetical protein Back11_22930 [Paenibacillus baekrokdamisoli]